MTPEIALICADNTAPVVLSLSALLVLLVLSSCVYCYVAAATAAVTPVAATVAAAVAAATAIP
jgi:hypothetical protein